LARRVYCETCADAQLKDGSVFTVSGPSSDRVLDKGTRITYADRIFQNFVETRAGAVGAR
jgi:hypothetical protein